MLGVAACEQKDCGVSLGCPADCHADIQTHSARSHGKSSSVFQTRILLPQGAKSAEPLAQSLQWGASSVLQGQADTDDGILFVQAPLLTQGCCTWQVFPVSSSHQGAAFSLSQCLGKLLVKGLQGPFVFSYACQCNIVPNLTFGHRPFCSACLVFISVSVRDPGLKLLEVQMTSGFSAPPEYWLQCLSVHYSSKLMMQSTTCCLQLSVRVERSWQKCLVFCEQHVINSLGACSLYVDDYSLWYVFVYFWVLCITSCAIFLSLFLIPALIEQKGQPFVQ